MLDKFSQMVETLELKSRDMEEKIRKELDQEYQAKFEEKMVIFFAEWNCNSYKKEKRAVEELREKESEGHALLLEEIKVILSLEISL